MAARLPLRHELPHGRGQPLRQELRLDRLAAGARGRRRLWPVTGDTSSLVTYHGSWIRLGPYSGSAASRDIWIGSKGPTQGKAAVYLDGKLVRIIDLHTAVRHYRVKLYTVTLSKVGLHYLTIKVLGSPGHPTVVVDGFLVTARYPSSAANQNDRRADPTVVLVQ